MSESDSLSLIVEFKRCPSASRQSNNKPQNDLPVESKRKKNSIDSNLSNLTPLHKPETANKVQNVKNYENLDKISETNSSKIDEDKIFVGLFN